MRFLLAAILSLTAAPALAADVPAPIGRPSAGPAAASWAGFYVGAHLGYGWGRADVTDVLAAPALGAFSTTLMPEPLKGATGGVQVGYNWQVHRRFVLGLEADVGLSDQSFSGGSPCVIAGVTQPGCTIHARERIRWSGMLRGRLGVVADRFLLYVTGGGAWQELESSGSVAVAGAGTFGVVDSTTLKGGYTVGAGVEAAILDRWSLGIEYLFVDTGTRTVAVNALPANLGAVLGSPAGTTLTETIRLTDNLLRLRVNYRF
jgi:outer membrane immunogenic protein